MNSIKTFVLTSSFAVGLVALACSSSGDSSATNTGGGGGTAAKGGSGGSAAHAGSGGSGATGGSTGPCTAGATQCNGQTPQTCDSSGKWTNGTACPFACSAGACVGTCVPNTKQCNGLVPQTCNATGSWVDGTACQYLCNSGDCTGVCTPGDKKCKLTTPQTCSADGTWQNGTACPYGCDNGACKDQCQPGQFHCLCNQVQQCDPTTLKWVDTTTPPCNGAAGSMCNETTGTCVTQQKIGTNSPTGTYYQYATFQLADGFKGGYDVDSFEDKMYVNRSGSYVDVYQVTIADSDGDGLIEPDQHPSNPLNTGPVEKRTLTFLKTISKAAPDNFPLGSASIAELYALSDRVFSLGPGHNGDINEFILGTGQTNLVVHPTTSFPISEFGFGDNDGVWYGSNESNRRVYSFCPIKNTWVEEFDYPDLAGSHMDGMEVIVSPKTGDQFVYVSDMTSDFIGQYRKDPTGWVQVNLFQYSDATGSYVEGMGFGAFNHFWATGGNYLYEIGGGDLAQYLE